MSDFDALTPQALDLRFDRRTGGTIKCKPPNRRCGDRCIPPNWDCRLKGEGNDSHLKAAGKGSDPIAGFASLERGITRIGTGVTRLRFSEVESGRRAIARGAAKLSPGDLQKKKELQEKVYNYGLAIGTPVAVIMGLALGHKGLKAFRGYREGPGRQVDEAAAGALRSINRNMPFGIGESYRAREGQGVAAVQANARALSNIEAGKPENRQTQGRLGAFISNAGGSLSDLGEGNRTAVSNRIAVLEKDKGRSSLAYGEWEERSLIAFWGAQRPNNGSPDWIKTYGEGTSAFSVAATNRLLARSYGLERKSTLSVNSQASDIVENIAATFTAQRKSIHESMRLFGLNPASPEDVKRYVQSIPIDRRIPTIFHDDIHQRIERIATSTSHLTEAKDLYRQTLGSFDKFFLGMADTVTVRPGIALDPEIRATSTWKEGTIAHSRVLAERLRLDGPTITSPGLGLIVNKAFHASRVFREKKKLYTTDVALTRSEAMTAAMQLADDLGESRPQTADQAVELLNTHFAGGSPENKRRLRSISLIQAPVREAPPPVQGPAEPPRPPRAARRVSDAQRLAAIRRERNPDGSLRYATAEAAQAELRRRQGRRDAARLDYTAPNERRGKPCGKSFVQRNQKCSKPTSRRYAERPQPAPGSRRRYPAGYIPNQTRRSHKVAPEAAKKVESIKEKAAKIAAVAGVAAGGAAIFANRKRIGRAVQRANPELYRQASTRTRLAARSLSRRGRQLQQKAGRAYNRAQLVTGITTINGLSSKQVQDGLKMVPEQWQPQVRSLVGRAKVGAAAMVLKADSSTLIDVDNKNNFSTFKHAGGHILTIGSVDDSLLLFRSHADNPIDVGGGNKAGKYIMDFTVDLKNSQKSDLTPDQSSRLVRSTKAMFNKQVEQLPDNSLISVTAYKEDALGEKRNRIYKKWGFRELPGLNAENLWAVKRDGKFSKFGDEELDGVAWLLKQNEPRIDSKKALRLDKRCGKSGIPDNRKCSKPTTSPEGGLSDRVKALASDKRVQTAAAFTAAGALAFHRYASTQQRIDRYRKNVSKSAVEAEKLALEYERKFKQDAAERLNKPANKVTGFEASVYNFKDKGYDRGFGGLDNEPRYFGQTPNSRGSVVLLSYADDGRFTQRGQGSFKMAEGGAFSKVWGEHDILPYANNISQPASAAPDHLDNKRFNKLADKIERIGGEQARTAAETVRTLSQVPGRFKYLRDNVNNRGFNPDSVRIAAFVAAQRRLTGKPVHIMSYSNGGSAATEALAILNEMGYRDVKVVNIAGPTFGLFEHSPDNMQTWVSEGDEFWKMTQGLGFKGSQVNKLKNDKIPHGLEDGLNVRDARFTKEQVKANLKEKNSYGLDEQLQREAYTFLTVDKKRSNELVDEVVWRAAENKPPEGDLASLYGDAGTSKFVEYRDRLSKADGAAKDAVKVDIRKEIEERMIETWYGGYDPMKVKRRSQELKRDLDAQTRPAPRAQPKAPTPPTNSLNSAIAALRKREPNLTYAQARAEVLKRRKSTSSTPEAA